MAVGIIGCAGRMGRHNLEVVLASPGLRLAGGVERAGHPALGQDLGILAGREPAGSVATDDLAGLIQASDVLIEFSAPEPTLEHLRQVAKAGKALVIGTTGFSAEQVQVLEELARSCPVVWAANMSLGVNLLLGLAQRVAASLDVEWDIEILEMHHRHKVDAPSGTALALGRAVAAGRLVALDEVAVRSRDGITGARPEGSIGFATLRGGDVIGDHVVMFAGEGERIELAHRASDRKLFARGAVRAARWLAGRPAGLYGMSDVLGL
ncbi:4-hydroxy-tetrahydrodipicolinate reductase [Geminicoccus roseus]|uniref:4-hydroxy-tetrahydrodipicolinate reductase n=1 Tax=Geminicoccus roseus TaxID=404900 RepID=UPI0004824A36|nr:4-hydroxy-tetrahydrodipicolinate reductase [Geminicoccus roseus]